MEKIGRNEKCPCGSGKKYKYCCSGKSLHYDDPYSSAILSPHVTKRTGDECVDRMKKFEEEMKSDEELRNCVENVGKSVWFHVEELHKEFNEDGPGAATILLGDASILVIYDPIHPLNDSDLFQMYGDFEKRRMESYQQRQHGKR